MPKMIYSFSRLSLYERCPYAFYLRYIEKREESYNEPLALGSAVHKAIQEILGGLSESDALLSGWTEIDFFPINPEEYKKLVNKAPVTQGYGLESNVSVEEHFKVPLSDDSNAPVIQGYIDLIEKPFGTILFTDWKTNRIMYEPMDTMQLPLYAWALQQTYGIDSITGQFHFLRFNIKNKKTKTFTQNEMETARSWAEDLAIDIEKKLDRLDENNTDINERLFPSTPSAHCRFCSFARECFQNQTGESIMMEEIEKIQSMEDAIDLANEIERTEAAVRQMKQQLRAFSKNNGPIETDDLVWDLYPSVVWRFSPDSLKAMSEFIAIEGENPWNYLTIPAGNLRKLGWSEETLSEFGKSSIRKSFRSKRKS